MNVVDSSGWLEYLADGPNADFFAPAIENLSELVVPTVSIYEVFKRVLLQRGESEARRIAGLMQRGIIVDLDTSVALYAATLSASLHLPMADSIILATTRTYEAILWTQDADFRNVENVQYIQKL